MIDQQVPDKEFLAAMSKMQGEFTNVNMDMTGHINEKRSYKYASLKSIIEMIRKPMATNGFSYTQKIFSEANDAFCETTLSHISGHVETSGKLKLIFGTSKGMQDLGAATTYARRYQVSALLGIVTEEDTDGEGTKPDQKPPIAAEKPLASSKRRAPEPAQRPPPRPKSDPVKNAVQETELKKKTALKLLDLHELVKSRGIEPATMVDLMDTLFLKRKAALLDVDQLIELIEFVKINTNEQLVEFIKLENGPETPEVSSAD